MVQERLAVDALQAGRDAIHNLKWIRKHPEAMLPGKLKDAEAYLCAMKTFAEVEMKNARRAGRALRLKHRINILLSFILFHNRQKSKAV
ncbi:hypothetical protein [Paenibacillus chibensis]|uniref:hypothetical protein n=1 Tax=Paenibacillus chibensis TaxID=59846 RepID=UPI000FD9AA86|nr:hypothetical protein [Paenibacillus chibensis]MEC0370857.1 hypothetical protein [Paenibacillus chibensis]